MQKLFSAVNTSMKRKRDVFESQPRSSSVDQPITFSEHEELEALLSDLESRLPHTAPNRAQLAPLSDTPPSAPLDIDEPNSDSEIDEVVADSDDDLDALDASDSPSSEDEDDDVYLSDDHVIDSDSDLESFSLVSSVRKRKKPKKGPVGGDSEAGAEAAEDDGVRVLRVFRDEDEDLAASGSLIVSQSQSQPRSELTDEESENDEEEEEEVDEAKKPTPPSHFELFGSGPDADEDDIDSDEDESIINPIGNIPFEWYDDFDHVGYDRSGGKIVKIGGAGAGAGDSLDDLIRKHSDPDYLRTIRDEVNQRVLKLSNESLEGVLRIQKGMFPAGFDQYKPRPIIFTPDSRFPLRHNLPSKRASLRVNIDQMRRVRKIRHAIKYRHYIPSFQREHVKAPQYYPMWDAKGHVIGGQGKHPQVLPPPPASLPGHGQSYRPPGEFVGKIRREGDVDPRLTMMHRIPQHPSFVDDRLKRCLELYLCTRERVKKFRDPNRRPEDLFPKSLPHPDDLRPYPEIPSVLYEGHSDVVRCLSIDPTGQWLISGDETGAVHLWEAETGRCLRVWNFGGPITSIAWNPNPELNIFLVAVDMVVFVIQPPEVGTLRVNHNTSVLFPGADVAAAVQRAAALEEDVVEDPDHDVGSDEEEIEDDQEAVKRHRRRNPRGVKRLILQWMFNVGKPGRDALQLAAGIRAQLIHKSDVRQVVWHPRGDYFASLAHPFIFIHQLSTRKSQKPFQRRERRKGGQYQRIRFHPRRPWFYIASNQKIKVYNLQRQRLRKVLKKQRCRYISDFSIHPNGDHVVIGGYDRRLEWFEVEIASRPCKSLKFHREAIRAVRFHRRYPLFASCSDDGNVHIFHHKVDEDDWVKDPLIVPVKLLHAHQKSKGVGVMDLAWHPFQPWIFTAGADRAIRLYTS